MQKSTSNRRTWLWLGSILLVFIGISYLVTSPDPEDYPDYVTESPSPTGVKGLYTYLEGAGRWSDQPQLLPKQEANLLLIMVQPSFIPNTDEMEAYTKFMESGNTILLVQSNPDGMFHVNASYIEGEAPEHIRDQTEEKYRVEISSPVRLKTNEQDAILLDDELGTIAFKRAYGKGELIVANTPEWITNGNLLKKDHLPLVLSLINEGTQPGTTILFDDYIHGAGNASGIFTVYPKWLLVLAVQVILLTIIWLWYQGKRFGPIMIAREETVRFSDERIKALAAWNLRSRNYQASIVDQANYLKLLIQERYGIPYQKEWRDITEKLGRKLPDAEIQSFVRELANLLRKEKITKQEYLLGSKKIDRIRKEVEQ